MFTDEQLTLLGAIHRAVFVRFIYTPDSTEYPDFDDYWAPIPAGMLARGTIKGDCDEFARVCLLKCIGSSINARLVFCLDENGDGHLICEAADQEFQQALFLDNRKTKPVNIHEQEGYHFIAVGPWNPEPGEKRPWLELDSEKLRVMLLT